jgi:hypothetical protein
MYYHTNVSNPYQMGVITKCRVFDPSGEKILIESRDMGAIDTYSRLSGAYVVDVWATELGDGEGVMSICFSNLAEAYSIWRSYQEAVAWAKSKFTGVVTLHEGKIEWITIGDVDAEGVRGAGQGDGDRNDEGAFARGRCGARDGDVAREESGAVGTRSGV